MKYINHFFSSLGSLASSIISRSAKLFRLSRDDFSESFHIGYKYLSESDKIADIPRFCENLFHTNYGKRNIFFCCPELDSLLPSTDLLINQFFSQNYFVLYKHIIKAFAFDQPTIHAPIPPAWKPCLHEFGLKYSILSFFYWRLFLLKKVLDGISRLFYHISDLFSNYSYKQHNSHRIYFLDIPSSCLPFGSTKNCPESFTIIDWFLGQTHLTDPLICHSVKHPDFIYKDTLIHSVKSHFPFYNNFSSIISFLSSSFIEILFCLLNPFTDQWQKLLLLSHKIDALRFLSAPKGSVYQEYWIHNSITYPPLWTYTLSTFSSTCHYYFYSDPFIGSSSKFYSDFSPYSLGNWSLIHAWSTNQSKTLKSYMPQAVINISKQAYIPFSDSPFFFCRSDNSPIISFFDIAPHKQHIWKTFCLNSGYLDTSYCIKFLSDVFTVASELNIKIMYKSKRHHSGRISKAYMDYLSSQLSLHDSIVVDPSVSPSRVIHLSDLSISMPYTSTLLIASSIGKPSCYYDPYGYEPILHDYPFVTTVTNMDQLLTYLKLQLKF